MRRSLTVFVLLCLSAIGILPAMKGADPSQRYYRVICMVHLTGSGKAGDPVLPEYIAAGTAAAQAGVAAAASTLQATATATQSGTATGGKPPRPPVTPAFTVARPGIIAWSMQLTDDGKMAIVHMVAADHHAFDSVLADTRPEVKVFEVGKTPKADIEKAMQAYKKDFSLDSFQVKAQ